MFDVCLFFKSIEKVGCNITNDDATHLRNDYEVEMASSIELGAVAFRKGLVSKSKITLQGTRYLPIPCMVIASGSY